MRRPQRQEGGEVGVSRYEDAVFFVSFRKNDFVTRVREAQLADVRRIVARSTQKHCEPRRQRVIDQKLQTECGAGSSRSRTEAAP